MPDVQSIKKQLHMQQWTAIIEDRLASGLKIDEYCEKNQLSRNSYFYWLRKIREERATSVLPDNNDLLPASVSTGTLTRYTPADILDRLLKRIYEINEFRYIRLDKQPLSLFLTNRADIAEDIQVDFPQLVICLYLMVIAILNIQALIRT